MNVLESDKRVDVQEYDQKVGSNVTSSYMILRNNMLEPIAMCISRFITMIIFMQVHLINMFSILFWSIFSSFC